MFTQKISMDCTKEQYEKHLRNELLKMGYEEDIILCWEKATNQHLSANNNHIGTLHDNNLESYGRTYLGKFNAPLFLALAAMTDNFEGGYREYYVKDNEFYSMKESGFLGANGLFRKATVSEIMTKFGEQPQSKGVLSFDVTFDAIEVSKRLDKIISDLEIMVKGEILSAYLSKVEKDVKEILGMKERMVYSQRPFKLPVIGELAIFWETGRKSKAVIGKLIASASDSYVFYESRTPYNKRQFCFDNAILFESIEQYNEFIKS